MGKKKKKAQKTKELSVAIAEDADQHNQPQEAESEKVDGGVSSPPQSPAPRKRGRPRKIFAVAEQTTMANRNNKQGEAAAGEEEDALKRLKGSEKKGEAGLEVEPQAAAAAAAAAAVRRSSRRKSKPRRSS